MDDLRKAAEEAAKVLANALSIDFNDKRDWYSYKHDVEYAANLLRQALAQPEQEPEAWMGITDNPYCDDADCNDPNGRAMRWHKKLLYLRKQEYTAPPSKPWVSLTDDEIMVIRSDAIKNMGIDFQNTLCRAIEAALRSKNT